MQKCDCVWLLVVALAAVVFSIWGLPYFTQLGHPLWSLIVYAFFVTLFVYGRANRARHHKRTPKPQDLQQK